jgi:ATP-dependent Clp protease ATP-binding subunit ClpA
MGGTAELAGRVGELQAVSDVLSGGGEPAAMLIVGEAGVGKSRLVAAAADAITEWASSSRLGGVFRCRRVCLSCR